MISLDKELESVMKKMYGKNLKSEVDKSDKPAFPFLNAEDDSKPLFPVLSKIDDNSPKIPNLSEMVGIKPLFPKQLGMLDHIRKGNIPSPFDYSALNSNSFLHHPTRLASTMDFEARLRRNRLL